MDEANANAMREHCKSKSSKSTTCLDFRNRTIMTSDDVSIATNSGHSSTHNAAATAGAVATALSGVTSLPQAFEEYPKGGATVAFLIVVGLLCWVAVTWLNNRRN
ncbi:hypothetical protein [Massilia sp. CT11-137]|uniref:hypothetical protein n=1 Tax=Massilia sp. CT11-137 TaxID=3393901 RepID=UPI0039A6CA9E